MHPADLADIVEDLSPKDREAIFENIDSEVAADALSEVDPDIQASILESLETEKAAEIVEEMAPDEAADVLGGLEDRSPDIMEDQVTYPIVSAMLGAPRVKDVRGFSDFGYSYVYIIFDEGTDIYWARSRTLEYLSKILPRLPQGVNTELGPDATGVGWVFQYALVDRTGHNLAVLRSVQDWFLRYQLQAVPGVAEVASLGGFVQQYQVNVDPNRLAAYAIPISKVVAVRGGNNDVGGRLVEFTGREYMVRGRGYAHSTADLEQISLAVSPSGVPVLVRDIGTVTLGPDIRRGVADLNGQGEVVSGIIVMTGLLLTNRIRWAFPGLNPDEQHMQLRMNFEENDLGSSTLNPGTYCNGSITISGATNVTFSPGMYI